MYINFIVEFVVIIVCNINLYNIFKYNESKFWSNCHKRMSESR